MTSGREYLLCLTTTFINEDCKNDLSKVYGLRWMFRLQPIIKLNAMIALTLKKIAKGVIQTKLEIVCDKLMPIDNMSMRND